MPRNDRKALNILAKTFTYTFDDSPCWAIATRIPEPKRKQGVKQLLAGSEPKTTPLVLYNNVDVLKFLTVERGDTPIQVRQMLGGIAIVDKATLIVALKSLKSWESGTIEPEVAFFQSEENAIEKMEYLQKQQDIYFDGLLEDLKGRVRPLKLEVLDFNEYLSDCLALNGEGKSVPQLINESAKAQKIAEEKIKSDKPKKSLFGFKK